MNKILKQGNKSLASAISDIYDDYSELAYGKKEVSKSKASSFVSRVIRVIGRF